MDNRETPLAPATGYRREDVAAGAGLECSSSALPAQQALREKWHRMLVEARAEEDHHKQAGELLAAAYMLGWRCALACLISDLDGTLKGHWRRERQDQRRDAAPELLSELEAAMEYIPSTLQSKARAAIAKAKGEK